MLLILAIAGTSMQLKAEIIVENLGVGGQNTRAGLKTLPAKLSAKPDHLVIFYGINDAFYVQKGLVPLDEFKDNLTRMIDLAAQAGVRNIFLIGPHPVNVEHLARRHAQNGCLHPQAARLQEHLTDYDTAIRQVAAATGATFIDWRARFLAESPAGHTIEQATANRPDCLLRCEANAGTPDGVHPTPAGYNVLGATVLKALKPVVQPGDRVACIGDSVTCGVHVTGEGTTTGDTYPAVLYRGLNCQSRLCADLPSVPPCLCGESSCRACKQSDFLHGE